MPSKINYEFSELMDSEEFQYLTMIGPVCPILNPLDTCVLLTQPVDLNTICRSVMTNLIELLHRALKIPIRNVPKIKMYPRFTHGTIWLEFDSDALATTGATHPFTFSVAENSHHLISGIDFDHRQGLAQDSLDRYGSLLENQVDAQATASKPHLLSFLADEFGSCKTFSEYLEQVS